MTRTVTLWQKGREGSHEVDLPLRVSIMGAMGSGKTTAMRIVRDALANAGYWIENAEDTGEVESIDVGKV